jgi:hypothetical protein
MSLKQNTIDNLQQCLLMISKHEKYVEQFAAKRTELDHFNSFNQNADEIMILSNSILNSRQIIKEQKQRFNNLLTELNPFLVN